MEERAVILHWSVGILEGLQPCEVVILFLRLALLLGLKVSPHILKIFFNISPVTVSY